MRSPQLKNSRAKQRAIQIERLFLNDLLWFAFLVAVAVLFLPIGAAAGEFRVHETKLATLKAKIHQLEEEIHHSNKDQLITIYKQLKEASEQYNEEKAHVRFKHPEKGAATDKKYTLHKLQSLEELQEDMTLDGKLNRFLVKFKSVYGESEEKKQKTEAARAPSSAPVVDPDSQDQSITLKK